MISVSINDSININFEITESDRSCSVYNTLSKYTTEILRLCLNHNKVDLKLIHKDKVIRSESINMLDFMINENIANVSFIADFLLYSLKLTGCIWYKSNETYEEDKRNRPIMMKYDDPLFTQDNRQHLQDLEYERLISDSGLRYYRSIRIGDVTLFVEWDHAN